MWNELLHRQVIFTKNRMKTLEGMAEQYERVGGNSTRIFSQQHAIQGQMGAGGGWRVKACTSCVQVSSWFIEKSSTS